MNLKDYMDETGMKSGELAILIGRDPSIVAKYRMRKIMPPLDVANQIVQLTKGKVSHADLLPASFITQDGTEIVRDAS